ncbi:helix-turn-helix domain-containing protein [Cohnella abietis]|uniref:DnaD domain-containing protein n=1 Tax=Cohnella abietis TaxID=2507935 RepID=A0A3T1D1X9_9BACL|nr:hypothetical protein [Cohnella abietis]BBI32015.1 hypothetical protein KCTCHS21_14140 [Cohnella abietis]
MDHSREIFLFYDWLETNSVTDSGINLWHALMHINSKTGWSVEFAVAISTLATKTGMKKDAIIRARHRLQQAGRIDFVSRTGQLSALYRINPFESFNQTQSATQTDSVVLNDSKPVTNRAQSQSQTAHNPLPLISSSSLGIDREKEKDRLLHLVNTHELKKVGAAGLDTIFAYLGVVETGVIELAIKTAEKKHLNYFVETIKNWISEGKTTVAHVLDIPEKGERPPSAGNSKSYSGRNAGSGKPKLPVAKDNGQATVVTPEQMEQMLQLARELKGTGQGARSDGIPTH